MPHASQGCKMLSRLFLASILPGLTPRFFSQAYFAGSSWTVVAKGARCHGGQALPHLAAPTTLADAALAIRPQGP